MMFSALRIIFTKTQSFPLIIWLAGFWRLALANAVAFPDWSQSLISSPGMSNKNSLPQCDKMHDKHLFLLLIIFFPPSYFLIHSEMAAHHKVSRQRHNKTIAFSPLRLLSSDAPTSTLPLSPRYLSEGATA